MLSHQSVCRKVEQCPGHSDWAELNAENPHVLCKTQDPKEIKNKYSLLFVQKTIVKDA